MTDLATTFMGIELRNPIIVGASHLTATIRKVRACEKAGAGAIVLRSIYERQVRSEAGSMVRSMQSPSGVGTVAALDEISRNIVLDDYLKILEEVKKSVEIPAIASIHCFSPRGWEEYASRIEGMGADALQLNLFDLGARSDRGSRELEKGYLDVVKRVRRRVKIPIAAKLSANLTSPAGMAAALRDEGVDGLVLFNRYYGPDIDVDHLKLTGAPVLSAEEEALAALRWIGILSGRIETDLAATGGIHSARGVLKQLLAGARAVELCTAFYTNGLDYIGSMTREIIAWMGRHQFQTISDFRGSLSQDSAESRLYEATQYCELETGTRR